jgi:hypothetical protein
MNTDTAEFIQNILMLADKFLKQRMTAMPSQDTAAQVSRPAAPREQATAEQLSKPSIVLGHDTAERVSKPGASPVQGTAQEDLREMLGTMLNVVKSLNAQVDMIDSRLQELERSLGLHDERMKTQTGARAERPAPDESAAAH